MWSPVPSWLRVPPTGSGSIPPPIHTRPHLLPVDCLTWEDFERLCLRLVEIEAEPVHTSVAYSGGEATKPSSGLYGTRGQNQHGIDVYGRDPLPLGETLPTRRYVCLQARRTKTVGTSRLNTSVDRFLSGRWAGISRKFIYATSASTLSTELVDEINRLTEVLSRQSIEFQVWGQEEISKQLKGCPEIVDDFFGRSWVGEFCGQVAADALGSRLDAIQVDYLRRDLARIYTASFGVADSGLIAFRFSETHPVGLLDRFVTPDLVSATPQTASLQQPSSNVGDPSIEHEDLQAILAEAAEWNMFRPDEGERLLRSSVLKRRRVEDTQVEDRRSADQWIGTEPLQIIVGDPGSGKRKKHPSTVPGFRPSERGTKVACRS